MDRASYLNINKRLNEKVLAGHTLLNNFPVCRCKCIVIGNVHSYYENISKLLNKKFSIPLEVHTTWVKIVNFIFLSCIKRINLINMTIY